MYSSPLYATTGQGERHKKEGKLVRWITTRSDLIDTGHLERLLCVIFFLLSLVVSRFVCLSWFMFMIKVYIWDKQRPRAYRCAFASYKMCWLLSSVPVSVLRCFIKYLKSLQKQRCIWIGDFIRPFCMLCIWIGDFISPFCMLCVAVTGTMGSRDTFTIST